MFDLVFLPHNGHTLGVAAAGHVYSTTDSSCRRKPSRFGKEFHVPESMNRCADRLDCLLCQTLDQAHTGKRWMSSLPWTKTAKRHWIPSPRKPQTTTARSAITAYDHFPRCRRMAGGRWLSYPHASSRGKVYARVGQSILILPTPRSIVRWPISQTFQTPSPQAACPTCVTVGNLGRIEGSSPRCAAVQRAEPLGQQTLDAEKNG